MLPGLTLHATILFMNLSRYFAILILTVSSAATVRAGDDNAMDAGLLGPSATQLEQIVQSSPGQIVQPLPGQAVQWLPGQLVQSLPGQMVRSLPGQMVPVLPGQLVHLLPGQLVHALPGQVVHSLPDKRRLRLPLH
jgi:hypothetical protein